VIVLLGVWLLAAAGCRVDVGVVLDVAEDGSGSVEVEVAVDGDGVERLGGDLAAVAELDDLRAAGWEVDGPHRGDDGGAVITAVKAFTTPEEGRRVLQEVTGEDGVLGELRIERMTSFARTEWAVRGVIDLSAGLEAFGDEALAAELDGLPIGRPVEDLEAELGQPLSEVLGFELEVRLPSDPSRSNGSERQGGAVVWEATLGGEPVEVEAVAAERRVEVWAWLGAAVVPALALLVYLVVQARQSRHVHRARHFKGRGEVTPPTPGPGSEPAEAVAPPS
jgi:hypothetical protein